MQAPHQEEETEKIGDHVEIEADLPLESAHVIRYSEQLQRLFQRRRRRDFPIFIWPQFVNTLVKFFVSRDHYRVYQWSVTTAANVQDLYNVNFKTLSWCRKGTAIAAKHLQNTPIYCVFYFIETRWVYKNQKRKQEKLERIRFFYD